MDDLYDLIETSTLENEYHSGLRPVVAWETPSEEELTAWKRRRAAQSSASGLTPFSMEWLLQHELGLFLFSAFVKETKRDYCRINFCEEVYRYQRSASRRSLRRARIILKQFLLPPKADPETGELRQPRQTEIEDHDLLRVPPSAPPLTPSELEAALVENMDFPHCSECVLGLKGSRREELVSNIQVLLEKFASSEEFQKDTPLEETIPPVATARETEESNGRAPPDTSFDHVKVSTTLFDVAECIVLETLRRDYWQDFQNSSHYRRLLNFLWYQDRPVVLEDFFPMRVLGRGGFGLVKACKKGTTGKLYAMKIMDKKRIKMKKSEAIAVNERKALASVQSKFVINLKYAFQSKAELYLILEIMTGGDLGYHLNKLGRFRKAECLYYAARIMLGLQALHDKKYVFRDLKPENCLLDEYGRVKITDLGLAAKITPNLHGAAGTRGYWAPEMLRRDSNGKRMCYGHTVDWFSFGCCVAEFITGRNPFRTDRARSFGFESGRATSKEMAYDFATLEMEPVFPPEEFEPDAADLCAKLLNKNEKERLGFKGCREIMSHPWFKSVKWDAIIADTERPPYIPPKGEINALTQQEIGLFSQDKEYQETVITEKDEEIYKGWEWTNPRSFATEVIEFLIQERKIGEPLLPPPVDSSCCCNIL